MMKEIGSNFWISPEELNAEEKEISLEKLGISGDDEVFLSTGRAAQSLVLDEIERKNHNIKKVALIPPYTCHTVIEPFLHHGYRVYSYPVDCSLQTTPEMLKRAILDVDPSIVLIHRYFGFDTVSECESIITEYSAKGLFFIEDRTQSLFSKFASLPVQYITGSLRKWAGLPDGGFAVSISDSFKWKPTVHDEQLMNAKIEASLEKYDYIVKGVGNKDTFLEKFRIAEDILGAEDKYFSISPVSRIIFSNLDMKKVQSQRRRNYNILFNALKNCDDLYSILPEADDDVSPLYFVLWSNNRGDLQRKLRDNQIYAPIVWPKEEISPEICYEAEELYKHALCIPVDQRYQEEDMLRVIHCILN